MTWKKFSSTLIDFIIVVGTGVLMFLVVNNFIQPGNVSGDSMYPSYHDKQKVLIIKHPRKIERGNVITFKYTTRQEMYYRNLYLSKRNEVVSEADKIDQLHIKRVVGLPGDTIKIDNNNVYVNGTLYETSKTLSVPSQEYTLADNEYFVCGDNIEDSFDSRMHGPILIDDIYGKVITGNNEEPLKNDE